MVCEFWERERVGLRGRIKVICSEFPQLTFMEEAELDEAVWMDSSHSSRFLRSGLELWLSLTGNLPDRPRLYTHPCLPNPIVQCKTKYKHVSYAQWP